jgi:ABC-type branched-subunit amino acid transport system substrate-binding protein
MRQTGHSIGRRAACALLVSPLAALLGRAQDRPAEPYMDRTKHQMLYDGPGGDEPEPTDLTEIRLGYFGPSEPRHVQGGGFWLGASKALAEVNRDGGYRGLPFRLVAKWSDSPWTAGGRMVVEMAYVDNVWAVIGAIDGVGTHIAEQVIAKVRLPLVDPASTDRSVNAAMVPFMFSCLPGDPAIAAALAPELAREAGPRGPVLICSTGHDERHCADEFRHWFAARSPGIERVLDFEPGSGELARIVDQAAGAAAALIIGNVADTAAVVRQVRGRSPKTILYAGPSAARSSFAWLAGDSAEGVRCPVLAKDASLEDGKDFAALQSYDAVRLVVAAIRTAGLNRIRICRALAALSPWQGAAGEIRWSALNRNARPVAAGYIRGGRLAVLDHPA